MYDALTAFQRFMDGNTLLVWCLFFLILMPVLTLVHELGHAAVALARTRAPVLVQVGREDGFVRLRLGRLVLSFDPSRSGSPFAGVTIPAGPMTPNERVVFAVAGPLAEAAAGFLLIAIGFAHASVLLTAGGGLAIGVAVISLLPISHRGVHTDGRHVLGALRGEVVDRAQVLRADALFQDRETNVTPLRERLFAVVPIARGLSPDDRSERAAALWNTAFAGWCWREAENAPRDVGAEIRAALERAAAEGLEEPVLTARAAGLVAASRAEFGPSFDTAAPPGEDGWFAFRFGGALREIERVRS